MKERKRFDRALAWRLVFEEKKTMTEVAKLFGVSKGAVSKALIELRPAVASQVALEAGARVVSTHLNTFGQLQKVSNHINETLDNMMNAQRAALLALKEPAKDGEPVVAPEISLMKLKDITSLTIKAAAEIREQLALQNELMKTMYDVNAIAEFQKHVLDTIGKANVCVNCGEELDVRCQKCGTAFKPREVIVVKLKEARALRSGVQFRP